MSGAVESLTAALTPARSVSEVIQRMRAIDQALPDSDGLKWFNFLYLSVTEEVQETFVFADPAWIDRLDVIFANLYFAAIIAWQERDVDAVPRAWRPLFENRFATDVARIQFALAGMNAHINRDLVVALLTLYDNQGDADAGGSVQHQDFTLISTLLERVEQRVRPTLVIGTLLEYGGHLAPLESLVANWSVRHAREAAWDHSQAFWHIRQFPIIRRASLDSLDGLTQLAGYGLLVRVQP